MKKLTLTLCAVMLLMLGSSSANAMMGSFRIADINDDGNPEIVLNQAGSIYVLDQDGGVITSKTLSDIYAEALASDNTSTKIVSKSKISGGMMGGGFGGGGNGGGMMGGGFGGGGNGGGMMGGGFGGGGNGGGMMGGGFGGGFGGMMGGGFGGMMGGGAMGGPDIEIADMDGDGIPEIVLRAPRALIVLANNLDFKSTITLPGTQY